MDVGKRHTVLLAGFIGNVVEWYDFALYGYMAGILSGSSSRVKAPPPG
jgi:MHS family proline/betaine transporter-like MFS transporter